MNTNKLLIFVSQKQKNNENNNKNKHIAQIQANFRVYGTQSFLLKQSKVVTTKMATLGHQKGTLINMSIEEKKLFP